MKERKEYFREIKERENLSINQFQSEDDYFEYIDRLIEIEYQKDLLDRNYQIIQKIDKRFINNIKFSENSIIIKDNSDNSIISLNIEYYENKIEELNDKLDEIFRIHSEFSK